MIPCHALLEAFLVLTRMPAPYRRPPEDVERILRDFSEDAVTP